MCCICFVHPIFRFWFLVTFGDEVTKILCNLRLHFARQDGQEGKKTERKSRDLSDKIPKTKRQKYGMNETIKSQEDTPIVLNSCLLFKLQTIF